MAWWLNISIHFSGLIERHALSWISVFKTKELPNSGSLPAWLGGPRQKVEMQQLALLLNLYASELLQSPPNTAQRINFRGAKDKYERKSYKCFWKQCFRKTNWRIFLWFRDSKDFPDKTNNWKAQTTKEIITTLNCIQVRTDFPLPVRAGYFS